MFDSGVSEELSVVSRTIDLDYICLLYLKDMLLARTVNIYAELYWLLN